ncbi:hypothetical protein DRN86_01595 [Candidatus Geothermarchaeota archaeon]|nr:MAG: hypothetical protein DRN86_01595 [Candidatus Geothermarchaeota archaeon]
MIKIRAFAVHFPKPRREEDVRSFLESNFSKYCPLLIEVERELKLDVFMNRVILPPINVLKAVFGEVDLNDLSALLENYLEEYKMDIAAIPIERKYSYLKQIPEILKETKRLYFSFNIGDLRNLPCLDLKEVVKLWRKIDRVAGQDAFTHLAFTYGSTPETPYFPATVSKRQGLSLSLLYATQLRDAVESGKGLKEELSRSLRLAEEIGRDVAERINLEFLGVDSSVSPWMKDSVARLIETIINDKFGSPGTHYAIFDLNKSINGLSKKIRTVGFNEVMLPLAEDNQLKRAVEDGRIGLRDFVSYIFVCVSGLDMVPIPNETSDFKLIRMIRDALVAGCIKGKTVGIRVILAEAKPGERINLTGFGNVPVLSI